LALTVAPMKRIGAIALAVALCAGLSAPARPAAADPVVVELYTSQGCEECWRANSVLMDLAERPDVLALTFAVDYWDYLGWPDSFARPEFTDRQESYMRAMRLRMLRTPQMIVDGTAQASGLDRTAVLSLVDAHKGTPAGAPDAGFMSRGRRAWVGDGRAPRGGADVWLVRYDPRPLTVAVTRGENRGRTVPHRNVVRELVRLGSWTGRARSFWLPPPSAPGLRSAVLVQGRRDGRLLAASTS
jgi:hypothetical protein